MNEKQIYLCFGAFSSLTFCSTLFFYMFFETDKESEMKKISVGEKVLMTLIVFTLGFIPFVNLWIWYESIKDVVKSKWFKTLLS